jgi:hypothetical protein
VGTRCADHVTPLYPQKLALTSPTGGGRSVGIVLSRTKAMGFINIGKLRSLSTQCIRESRTTPTIKRYDSPKCL